MRLVSVAIVFIGWVLSAASQVPILTFEQFLQRVERFHPTVLAANYEPDIAEAEIRSALGRFDPLLSLNYDSKLKSGSDKATTVEGSIELPLDMMFGPKLKADYRRGLGFQLDPENRTSSSGEATVGIALPVFQGIFTDARRNALRKALIRPDIARAQFRIDRNTLIRSAALRYWDWCEAIEQRRVVDTLVQIARNRLAFVARRASFGENAKIDSVEAFQEVLRREGDRIRAERIEQQAFVDMNAFVWDDQQPVQLRQFDSEPLPDSTSTPLVLDSALQIALSTRPEILRASLMIETFRFDSSLASEFMRPFVEVNAGLVNYDVSNPGTLDYKVGLKIHQPLLFRQAAAQVQTTSIAVDRAELTLSLIQRMVEIDAQNAIISYQKAQERVRIARSELLAAHQMVDAEQAKFIAGDSDLLRVNIRERLLAESLQRYVSARSDVVRAKVILSWAIGVI